MSRALALFAHRVNLLLKILLPDANLFNPAPDDAPDDAIPTRAVAATENSLLEPVEAEERKQPPNLLEEELHLQMEETDGSEFEGVNGPKVGDVITPNRRISTTESTASDDIQRYLICGPKVEEPALDFATPSGSCDVPPEVYDNHSEQNTLTEHAASLKEDSVDYMLPELPVMNSKYSPSH